MADKWQAKMNYYEMRDDLFSPDIVQGRWQLSGLKYGNDHQFYDPPVELMEPGSWAITLLQDGVETDFSNISGTLPIVSRKIKDALSDLEEIKTPYQHTVIEPVKIEEKDLSGDYYIMITEDHLDCVDEEQSILHIWDETDAPTQGQVGHYTSIEKLVIDPDKVDGRNIFRLSRCRTRLIVSELVKERIGSCEATGVVFEPVT